MRHPSNISADPLNPRKLRESLSRGETISDVMTDPDFVRLVQSLMDEEVTPTLPVPPGADLAGYKRSLLERFANPALKHRTWQIAMDGSQKLPQRLLGGRAHRSRLPLS